MQEYTYIRTVGEGAYGDVWLTQRRGGSYCAVKVFKQAHEDPEIKALAKREARILQSVSHINCVKLLDAFKSKSGRVYLFFEYVERSLLGELDVQPFGLRPAATKLIAWQLLHATAYLHGLKIVHRDIKPANILLTPQGLLKLCDFGFARSTRCGVREVQPLSTYVVTRWYRSPEVLVSAPYGPSADIWSIGCTLAEVATGRPLFPGRSTADQLWRIMRCRGPLPRHLADRLGTDSRLRGIPIPTPSHSLRQRLPELDPRLHQLIDECLQLDPEARLSAEELLQLPYFWDVPLLVAGSPLAGLYDKRSQPYSSEMAAASAVGIVGMQQQQQQRQVFGEGRRRPLDDPGGQQDGGMKKKQGFSSECAVEGNREADGRQVGVKYGKGQEGELQFQKLRGAQREKQQQQMAGCDCDGSCGEAVSATAAVAGSQGSGAATEPSGPGKKAAVGDEGKLVCERTHAAGGPLSGQQVSGLKTPSTDKASTTSGQWRKQRQEQQQQQQEEEGESPAGIAGSRVLPTMPAASSTRSIVTSSRWRSGTLSSPGGTMVEPTTVAAVKAAARLGLSLPYNPHGTSAAGGESRSVSDEPTAAVTLMTIDRDAADGTETCTTASLICPVEAAGTGSCRTVAAAAAADMAARNSQSEQLPTLPLAAVTATVSPNCFNCTAAGDSTTLALMPSLTSGDVINSSVTSNITLSRLPRVAAPSCPATTAANGGRQYDTAHCQPPTIGTVATVGPPPRVGSPSHGTFSDTRLMRLRVPAGGGAARGLRTTAQRRGMFGHHHQHHQASVQQRQMLAWAAVRASVGGGGRPSSSLGQIREPDSGFEHGDDDDESCGRIGSSDLGYTAAARTVIDGGPAGWARAGGRLRTHGGAVPGAHQGLETLSGSGFAFPTLQWPYDGNSTGGGGGLAAGGVLLDSIPFGEMLTPAGAPDMPSYNGVPPPHRRPPVPLSGSPWFTPSQNNNSDSLFLLTSFNRNAAVTGSQRASLQGVVIGDIEQAGSRPTESESVAVVSGCAGIGVGAEGSVHTLDGDMGTTPCSSQSSATAAARAGGSWGNLLVGIDRSGGSASSGTAVAPHGSDSSVHVRLSSLRAQPAQRSRLGSGLWVSDGPPPGGSAVAGSPTAATTTITTVTPSGGTASGQLSKVHAVTAVMPSPPTATTNNNTSVPCNSSPRGANQHHMESAGSRPSHDSLPVLLSAGVQLSPAEGAGAVSGPHQVTCRPAQQQPQPPQPPQQPRPPQQQNARRVGLIREAWRQAVGRVPSVDSSKVVVRPVVNGITATTAVEVADGGGVVLHEDVGTTRDSPAGAVAAAAASAAAVEGNGAEKVGEGGQVGGWAVMLDGAAAVQPAARLEKQDGIGAAVAVEASSGAVVYGDSPDKGQRVEVGEKKKKKKWVMGLWRSISKALGLRPSIA